MTSLVRWAVGFVAVVVILRELGVDVLPIIVSAGVLGLAIGFGAQSLIRDVITGFFLLFEGLLHVGDGVQIGATTGVVESMGLRVTTVRTEDGAAPGAAQRADHRVRELRRRRHAGLGGGADRPRGAGRRGAGRAGRGRRGVGTGNGGAALDRSLVPGIMGFSGGEVILRLTVRVAPEQRLAVEGELRRRIKAAFDRRHWPPIGAAG